MSTLDSFCLNSQLNITELQLAKLFLHHSVLRRQCLHLAFSSNSTKPLANISSVLMDLFKDSGMINEFAIVSSEQCELGHGTQVTLSSVHSLMSAAQKATGILDSIGILFNIALPEI